MIEQKINKNQIATVTFKDKERNHNYWYHTKRKGLFSFLSKSTGWYHVDSNKRFNEPNNKNQAVTSYFENERCYYHPHMKLHMSDCSVTTICFTSVEAMEEYYKKEIKPFIQEL